MVENWPVSVTIACATEGAAIRYTIDGSDPTAESPIYGGPFTIDETTGVKAKAFGDQFFNSTIVTAWQTVTQAISGDGAHTLVWKYVKDDMSSEGEDCCRVADFRWTPAVSETQTTEVPVPYDWLRDYFPETPDEYDSYEAGANATAANGVNKVWECYVAGLCLTNAAETFRAVISWNAGVPVISWEPELAPEEAAKRIYRKYGKKSLTDPNEDWTEINGDEALFNFFKVSVEMAK